MKTKTRVELTVYQEQAIRSLAATVREAIIRGDTVTIEEQSGKDAASIRDGWATFALTGEQTITIHIKPKG